MNLPDRIYSGTVGCGTETILGPLYFAVGSAEDRKPRVDLTRGRRLP